jgi:hypothetical protein
MNYDYPQTDLSRGALSGLFAGLVAIVANAAFVLIYRSITNYYENNGLDITVIIFGSIIQLMTCGLLFSFFVHYLKKGVGFYRVMVVLITVLIFFLGIIARRSIMGTVSEDFKFMVVGTQVIIGCLAALFIPYLFRHDKIIS